MSATTSATERGADRQGAPPEPLPVVDLTDEELAALDGPPTGLVVSPYLEELGDEQRDLAVVTAFRSLVARGLVVAPSEEQAAAAAREATRDGAPLAAVEVQMAEELSQVLTLRRVARTVVCGQRTTSERRTWRYVHVVDDELSLDELVEPTGLHRYGLVRTADVPDLLVDWVAPDGLDGADGPVLEVDATVAASGSADAALLDRLAAAHVLTDLSVRHAEEPAPPPLLGTFAGPGLLVLSTTTFGAGESVRLRPVSRRTLRSAVVDQLERTPS